MKITNLSLVQKYANGEYIEEELLNQLENSMEFMKAVICYTNDPNIYNMCSDTLKTNYEFVKFLLLKFKENANFIKMVSNRYLEKNPKEDYNRLEIMILLADFLPEKESFKFKAYAQKAYQIESFKAMSLLSLEKELTLDEDSGLGFIFMLDSYHFNEFILNYFAKCMMNDILFAYKINLEEALHQQVNTKEDLKALNFNEYLIKLFSTYDATLGYYLSTHLDLLSDLIEEIQRIKTHWDAYGKQKERKDYFLMLDAVHKYMMEANSSITETEMLYYVAQKLGIIDKVRFYDAQYSCVPISELDFKDEMSLEIIKEQIEANFQEQVISLNVQKIMEKVLPTYHEKDVIKNSSQIKNTSSKDKISYLSLKRKQ